MSENVDNNKTLENDHIFNVTDNVDYNYMIKYSFVTWRLKTLIFYIKTDSHIQIKGYTSSVDNILMIILKIFFFQFHFFSTIKGLYIRIRARG